MNLVLNIEGMDVEVDKSFDFAITTTYEELQNPTIINNEWSKTLEIPMTASNNRLFGDIFDIERAIVYNDGSHNNVGIYFNPTKKANFTLLYNSGVLMTGYVKLSAVDNVKHVYEVNLFGEIGNTFLELLKCSFNSASVDNARYIMPNYLTPNRILDKDYVKESWDNDSPRLSLDDEELEDTDIIGFAPTVCGLPKDFDADTILDNNGDFKKLADVINDLKSITYGDSIIGDGLTERQYGQFRSWNQKPYIYVNKLWQMFEKKSNEICEFPLRLDKSWFNKTNPYYSDLIYLCTDINMSEATDFEYETASVPNTNMATYKYALSGEAGTMLRVVIDTGADYEDLTKKNYHHSATNYGIARYTFNPYCYLSLKVKYGNNETIYAIKSDIDDWHVPVYTDSDARQIVPTAVNDNGRLKFTFEIYKPVGVDNFEVIYNFKYYNTLKSCGYGNPYGLYTHVRKGLSVESKHVAYFNAMNEIEISDTTVYKDSKYVVELKNIWNPDVAPFDVLLNYAKMFGLIFQVNQRDRCIDVTCRNLYFKDYKIVDWTDKVNTLSVYKIEQPTFEKRYVNFNYDEVDADNYKEYFDKYQIAIGGKKLVTEYEFNDESENLFEGIQPTNVVNEYMYTLKQIINWTPYEAIEKVHNKEVYFDNQKGNESADIYSAFAFRCKNQNVDTIGQYNYVCITDDTDYERNADTYCYHAYTDAFQSYRVASYILPYISIIDDSGEFGCVFNIPAEIGFDETVMPYDNAGFVYDNFWREYINERYNQSNKKVTLQVNLTPLDFANFQFNNFVKIGNKLFIVNEIKDYGIENGQNTEVELISITDIEGYTAGKTFHFAYWENPDINVPYTGQTSTTHITAKIEADIAWSLSTTSRGAITLDKSSGTGSDEINIYITPLRSGLYSRTIAVNILNSNNEIVDVLKITQFRSNE